MAACSAAEAALSEADLEAPGLSGVSLALAATRHLLEMYRRRPRDEKTRRLLLRLDKRLFKALSHRLTD